MYIWGRESGFSTTTTYVPPPGGSLIVYQARAPSTFPQNLRWRQHLHARSAAALSPARFLKKHHDRQTPLDTAPSNQRSLRGLESA